MSNEPDTAPAYETDFEAGQDNVQVLGFDMHNPVFFVSAALVVAFVAASIAFPSVTNAVLVQAKAWVIGSFDWLFLLAGNFFVLFCVGVALSPAGRIRLGGDTAQPEFGLLSWFAMLFAAGMGIGLMFWSVAEPVAYFTNWYGTPLNTPPNTEQAASIAMGATMYHWGLHPWAIYAVVGMSLSYFAYNHNLPLTIRSAFYPLLGDRCWGWAGHLIDTLAVLATIFGLATSLGLGAQQAAGGFEHLFGIESSLNSQIGIIVGVTSVAVISVVRGVDGGVKLLSNINMLIALLLLLFVAILGTGLGLFGQLISTSESYLRAFVPLSNFIGREDESWLHGWTIFYWAWWISWSPFVGMFIARISKGRTIRQFIIAVLLVPTVVTIVWMSAFGGTAIEQAQSGVGELAGGIGKVSIAFFQMLENLPWAGITSFVAIVLVLVFFVTSSDSGSLVIDSITAGGKLDAPVAQRVFWAVMEGAIAGALLYGGGKQALNALQAGAISTGLPFTVLLLVMCISIVIGLRRDLRLGSA